jgi:hypothetical protein
MVHIINGNIIQDDINFWIDYELTKLFLYQNGYMLDYFYKIVSIVPKLAQKENIIIYLN